MPPEDKTNKNIPNLDTFKVGIDPVFGGNPADKQKVEDQMKPASAFNVLANQKYTPTAVPVSVPQPMNNPASPKSIVRTYKGDLAEAIETNHLSSINIAIAENERMHNQIGTGPIETAPAGNYSKNKIIIFISSILIIIGIIGIVVVSLVKNQNSNQVAQTQELPSLITAEYQDELNVNTIVQDRLASALGSKLNDIQIPVNNLYSAYLTIGTDTTRRLLTSAEFVSQMGFNMPDIIKRTLLPDFMVGMYSFGKNLPFIILKTSYFENAYTGMLIWEKDLEEDFRFLFRLPGYENSGGISAELTPTVTKKFEDGVIINKDVRLLRDEDGNVVLLYGITDKETIVITVNDQAFKEIINRLNKEKSLKR